MRLGFAKPDHLVLVPDYNPAFGLDDNTRAEVLRLVVVDGLTVQQAVAKSPVKLHQSTVYKWLRAIRKDF
jgi:hypothetical protein